MVAASSWHLRGNLWAFAACACCSIGGISRATIPTTANMSRSASVFNPNLPLHVVPAGLQSVPPIDCWTCRLVSCGLGGLQVLAGLRSRRRRWCCCQREMSPIVNWRIPKMMEAIASADRPGRALPSRSDCPVGEGQGEVSDIPVGGVLILLKVQTN